MQIVIDISEEEYAAILGNAYVIRKRKKNTLEGAVLSGTPLPKGHGRLIDRDKLELDTEWDDYYDGFTSYSEMQIRDAETIIESDKEEEINEGNN